MPVSRRIILGVGGAVVVAGGATALWLSQNPGPAPVAPASNPAGGASLLPTGDAKLAERAIGRADAPVVVHEFFSMTCPHCAAFHKESMPQIHKNLVETGKIRMIFHDFPLDKLALTASVIARYLPADRYEPFCAALLGAQERWIYPPAGSNTAAELRKFAALAGLSRTAFDAALADQTTANALLAMQDRDAKSYQVDSTPTFIFSGKALANHKDAGAKSYDEFAKLVATAGG